MSEFSPTVLELFGRQYGVASTRQLVGDGMSRSAISRAIECEAIRRVTASTVLLAGRDLSFEARAMAGFLHCGPNSFVSGQTAGAFNGLRYMDKRRTHLTALNRTQATAPPWLDLSRTTWMIAGDIVDHPSGLRLAHPLRNLHQLAASMSRQRFERAAEDAWHLGLVTPSDAAEYLERMRRQGRTGVTVLDEWLDKASRRKRPAQSGLERDALEAIQMVALPEPARQHPLRVLSGQLKHVDIAWPDIRYGVEPGHSWWHGGDLGQRRSQFRQREFEEIGWQVTYFDESMSANKRAAALQIERIYRARHALLHP